MAIQSCTVQTEFIKLSVVDANRQGLSSILDKEESFPALLSDVRD